MIQEADRVTVVDLGASTVGLIPLEQMERWLAYPTLHVTAHQLLTCWESHSAVA